MTEIQDATLRIRQHVAELRDVVTGETAKAIPLPFREKITNAMFGIDCSALEIDKREAGLNLEARVKALEATVGKHEDIRLANELIIEQFNRHRPAAKKAPAKKAVKRKR